MHHAFVSVKASIGQTVFSTSVFRAIGTQGRKNASTPFQVIPYLAAELNKVYGKALGFNDFYKSFSRPYPRVNHRYGVRIRDSLQYLGVAPTPLANRHLFVSKNFLKWAKTQFLYCSQLNGINGEVTGTDDLSQPERGFKQTPGTTPHVNLQDLERNRREARNATYSRSRGGVDGKRGKAEVNYANRQARKQGGTSVSASDDVVQEPLPQIVETFTCYVIPNDFGLYEIQGSAYSTIPQGYNLFTGLEDFVPVGGLGLIGRKLEVQSCGTGWFIRSNIPEKNRVNYVTSGSCTLLVNDGFSYRDKNDRLVHCGKKEFVIYKPLFSNLIRNVKSDSLTDFVVRQAMIVASGLPYFVDGLPSHPIILSTVEAYKYWLFRSGIKQQTSDVRRFITMNFDALGYHETQHALHEEAWIAQNHIVVDGAFSPWTEESITADNLDLLSWEPREDFRILACDGVDITTGRFVFGEDEKYPSRFKVTKFFSFEGLGLVPFNKHTKNNVNLSHGCKRLIGCRGSVQNERELRTNALVLASMFLDRSNDLEVRLFKKCAGNRRVPCVPCEGVYAFLAESYFEMLAGMTPGFVQCRVDAVKTWMHSAKHRVLEQWYQHNPFYGRELWAKVPHAKAKQRMHFVGDRKYHHEEYCAITKMEVCIKDELAKSDKPCRLFINLDSESSYAPTLPMHTKLMLHGTHMFKLPIPGTSRTAFLELFVYAQPDPSQDEMDYIARKLAEARLLEDYLFVALHSDDSVMVGNIGGRCIMCNNDISSNDSGQDAPAFFGLAKMQSVLSPGLAEGLLDLTLLPIEIRSPSSSARVLIQFDKPLEPSGHGNTSCLNHVGTSLVTLSIFHELVMSEASLVDCVSSGARLVGHVVTCEVCECLEDLQFLKFSPVLVQDGYIMSANLGRIFRRLGCVDNDLTHLQLGVDVNDFRVMTPQERMDRFWTGVILGYKNEPPNVILDALRRRFDASRFLVTESSLSFLQDGVKDSYFLHSRINQNNQDCTESVMRRYKLTSSEVSELVSLIDDLSVGQRFKLTSVAKFYSKDYGVGCVTDSPQPVAIGTQLAVDAFRRRTLDAALDMFFEDEEA